MEVFIIVVSILLLLSLVIYFIFPIISVSGNSMYPTYKDGEILIGTMIFNRNKLKIGDVVVYRSPSDDRLVIKRITDILLDYRHTYFFFEGDNKEDSYDSRNYGYVHIDNLVCKVINQRKQKKEC